MALLSSNRALCRLCLKKIQIQPLNTLRNKCSKIVTLEMDSLDEFTSRLIQRKVDKWNMKDKGFNLVDNYCDHFYKEQQSVLDLRNMTEERINTFIKEKIEIEDNTTIIGVAKQCIDCNIPLCMSNILYILNLCAQRGEKQIILGIIDICRYKTPSVLKDNSNFKHFLAQAIWMNGNIHESLKLFEDVYQENVYLRRQIRLMLKSLISNVISSRSEAALVTVVQFCEKLSKRHQDIFPLLYVWQTCFLSEWFHDQQLALKLLDIHSKLRKSVTTKVPYVVAVSLRNHRTEIVYRLLELFLKHDMKNQYSGMVLALLNYQIEQRDLKGCVEIIQWSFNNNINLPTVCNEKFLNLLLSHKETNLIEKEKIVLQKRSIVKSQFKF